MNQSNYKMPLRHECFKKSVGVLGRLELLTLMLTDPYIGPNI